MLNATWYLTANNSHMYWDGARFWAAGLTVGTFNGWSLPSADPTCGFTYNCTTSQMGELYYRALGNAAGIRPPDQDLSLNLQSYLSNTGPFKNLDSYVYWSGTEYAPNPNFAWIFNTHYGYHDATRKSFHDSYYALAVRPGCAPWRCGPGGCRTGARVGSAAAVGSG